MVDEHLDEAMETAQRFLTRAMRYKRVQAERKADGGISWVPCKERAALKRTSLDLTRILADLRRTR